jgi:hypothetical protein
VLVGDVVTKDSAAALIDRHLNAPFAYPALREQLRNAGIKAIERYFDTHGREIANTEFSEKQIQVTSREELPSTTESTLSAAWTLVRWRSSTLSPPTVPKPRMSPAANSTYTLSDIRNSRANPPT